VGSELKVQTIPRTIALIPARAGSKGFPNKNLSHINGKSLVRITLERALQVEAIDEIYLSTDSQKIGEEIGSLPIKLHRRSETAATDEATAEDVITDFFSSLDKLVLESDPTVVYLQPTSPMRTSEHIEKALALSGNSLKPIVSLRQEQIYLEKLVRVNANGLIERINDAAQPTRNRQEIKDIYYRPNGAIYIFKFSDFKNSKAFPIENAVPFYMNEISSLDIDSSEDLQQVQQIESGNL
jgi:CMP-N,N'-diacetyllegionaminic acid synthase